MLRNRYLANPDLGQDHMEEIKRANASIITKDGWLRSGDLGKMGKNGMFKITGRMKELIITAGGENVAPVPMEQGLVAELPAISNCMMVGDKLKFNSVLISLRTGGNMELPGGVDLKEKAALVDPECKTIDDARKSAAWAEYIKKGINAVNAQYAASQAAKIQADFFYILPTDFSVQGGELTPTMKLKRKVVMEKYKTEIENLYSGVYK